MLALFVDTLRFFFIVCLGCLVNTWLNRDSQGVLFSIVGMLIFGCIQEHYADVLKDKIAGGKE